MATAVIPSSSPSTTGGSSLIGGGPSTVVTQQQRVQLILLYHPQCDIRTATALPAALLKRLAVLYGSPKHISVGQIRYGFKKRESDDEEVSLELLQSPQSKLAIAPFSSIEEFSRQMQRSFEDDGDVCPSFLVDTTSDVRVVRKELSWQDRLDREVNLAWQSETNKEGRKAIAPMACLCDGLVAAVEMFTRSSSISPLARYLIHIMPTTCTNLIMSNHDHPHSNLDSHHDDWSWSHAACQLGKMGVWPSSIALPDANVSPPASTPPVLSPDAERIQKVIMEKIPSSLPSFVDSPSILGPMFKQPTFASCIHLTGLSDAAATAARATAGANVLPFAGRKRTRKSSLDAVVENEGVPASISLGQADSTNEAGKTIADPNGSSARTLTDADKQAIQKVLFLQQQQQMMMRNVKILKQQEDEKTAVSRSPTRSRLLDQFREQLVSQHDTLRTHYSSLNAGTGGDSSNSVPIGSTPNLNESLQALISIDKAATDKGIHLGGPSSMQALVQQHRQRQLMQQQQEQSATSTAPVNGASMQASVAEVLPSSGSAAVANTLAAATSVAGATASSSAPPVLDVQAASAQQARRPGAPAVWAGAITWNMALPNKQRNAAATFVTALCAPNTKPEALMLPWPQRFVISEVQTVSLSAMQQYASTNAIPCIMFNPRPLPVTAADGSANTPMSNQNNETMYMMLARMIDSKHGCAFMKLQGAANAPSEAGVVIVPTSQPGGGPNRRLLGLVFRHAVPWHLFSPQQGAATGSGGAPTQSTGNPVGSTNTTANALNVVQRPPVTPKAPQALFQQPQPQQQQSHQPPPPPPQQQQQQQQQQAQRQNQAGTGYHQAQQTPLQPAQATPLPQSLGNLSALSASHLAQQLPAWAAARAQIQQQQQQPPMNVGLSADVLNSMGFANGQLGGVDFNALAAQLNMASRPPPGQATSSGLGNGNGSLAGAQVSANVFGGQGTWGANDLSGTATKQQQPLQQQQQMPGLNNNSQQAPSSAVDLEALQRILGLGSN